MTSQTPSGFKPLFRTSPFLDTLGPFFYRETAPGFLIGLRVAQKHANAGGSAHGGVLMTLADISLGYTAAAAEEPPPTLPTVHISADFAGYAPGCGRVGAPADHQKAGGGPVFSHP